MEIRTCPALDELAVVAVPRLDMFRSLAPWHCPGSASSGVEPFTVPAHFLTDGASIPWPLWSLIGSPMRARFVAAAVAHDYLYSVGHDRRAADALFRELLLENTPTPPTGDRSGLWANTLRLRPVHRVRVAWYVTRCWLMWLAVRGFGWWPWRKHKRRG